MAHNNIWAVYLDQNRQETAMYSLQEAIRLKSDLALAFGNNKVSTE